MPPYIRGDSSNLTATDHVLLSKYLLGAELDAENLRRIERLYFSNQSVLEQLQLVEDQLIEQYIRAELSREDARLFQEHFLASPRNQERFVFFRQLSRLLEEQNPIKLKRLSVLSKEPAWLLLAAGLVLLMIPAVWLLVETRHLVSNVGRVATSSSSLKLEIEAQSTLTKDLADQLRREQAAIQKLEKGETPASLPSGRAEVNGSIPATLSFLLMPVSSQTRGQGNSEPVRHAISRSAGPVQLDLVLPEGPTASAYSVSMDTPDGIEVWSAGPLTPLPVGGLRVVRAIVPTNVIGNDDYAVNLQSIGSKRQLETVETYAFRTLVTR